MGIPGPMELTIILVIVALLFGVGKLSGVGKALGTSIHEFKEAMTPNKEKHEEKPVDPPEVEKTAE